MTGLREKLANFVKRVEDSYVIDLCDGRKLVTLTDPLGRPYQIIVKEGSPAILIYSISNTY